MTSRPKLALMLAISCFCTAVLKAQSSQSVSAPAPAASEEEIQQSNDRMMKLALQRIKGHEQEPAEKVFRNIQIDWLKPIPAERLLTIMNYGYARALGVTCTHCHVEGDFSSDQKQPKEAAREMAVMHHAINDRLRAMTNLEDPPEERNISCSTCHRGQVNPLKAKT